MKIIFFRSSLLILLLSFVIACDDDKDKNTESVDNIETISFSADKIQSRKAQSQATATGQVIINKNTRELSGSVTASGFEGIENNVATVAHIHTGISGTDGEIAVTLTKDTSNANKFNVPVGTILSATQLTDLLAGKLYVNIHSTSFQSGEVRGQILPKGLTLYHFEVDATQVVVTTTTSAANNEASAFAFVTANANDLSVMGFVVEITAYSPTAAHIHLGAVGTNGTNFVTLSATEAPAVWEIPRTILSSTNFSSLTTGCTYIYLHS